MGLVHHSLLLVGWNAYRAEINAQAGIDEKADFLNGSPLLEAHLLHRHMLMDAVSIAVCVAQAADFQLREVDVFVLVIGSFVEIARGLLELPLLPLAHVLGHRLRSLVHSGNEAHLSLVCTWKLVHLGWRNVIVDLKLSLVVDKIGM